jgi:hypothetical protein
MLLVGVSMAERFVKAASESAAFNYSDVWWPFGVIMLAPAAQLGWPWGALSRVAITYGRTNS